MASHLRYPSEGTSLWRGTSPRSEECGLKEARKAISHWLTQPRYARVSGVDRHFRKNRPSSDEDLRGFSLSADRDRTATKAP